MSQIIFQRALPWKEEKRVLTNEKDVSNLPQAAVRLVVHRPHYK